jgi:hypothetical protein
MLYLLAIEHTTTAPRRFSTTPHRSERTLRRPSTCASARVLLPLPIALVGIFLVVHAGTLGFGMWHFLGLLSAVCSGAAVTAMRAARRTEGSWSVYASFCLFGTLVNAPFALRSWTTPNGHEWVALGATAIFAMIAQLLLTFSLRWVDALTVGVISHWRSCLHILGAVFPVSASPVRAAVAARDDRGSGGRDVRDVEGQTRDRADEGCRKSERIELTMRGMVAANSRHMHIKRDRGR